MLVYSKYLEEIGVKKGDFPFKRDKQNPRYCLSKKLGVIDAQTFSLDFTIIMELYIYLRYFQDHCMKGIPARFENDSEDSGMTEWKNIVNKIVEGLKAYFIGHSMVPTTDEELKEQNKLFKQFDEAWKLLGENLQDFWW